MLKAKHYLQRLLLQLQVSSDTLQDKKFLKCFFENIRNFARLREEVQLIRSILSGESVKAIDVIRTQDIFLRNQPPFEVDYTGSLCVAKSPYNFALEEAQRTRRFLFRNRRHKTNRAHEVLQ